MASWMLLDDKSESELHKTRLLNVEEKPFKRITKRLVSISTAVVKGPGAAAGSQDPSPLLNADSLQVDLTHDFAAFDSSIARFQFLNDANQRERERYAADQQRILGECQDVKANNARLRDQLESARATLAQRKKFDELAERITSSRLLRPREDQIVNLAKLEDECRELERESETYSETWKERRDQFNRIMEEGKMLRRQIRDEKEEVDRREGMNEGDEDDAEGDKDGQTPRNLASELATPHADADQPKTTESAADTPRPASPGDARTPLPISPGPHKPRSRSALSKDAQQSDQAVDDGPQDDVDMEDGQQEAVKGNDDGDKQTSGEAEAEKTRDSMEVDG